MSSTFFPFLWALAGPNIAKKVGPLQKGARGDRQTHLGTFDLLGQTHFETFNFGNAIFWRLRAPKTYISSSRLDHGLKFYGIKGGCASSRLIHGSLFAIFGRASGQILQFVFFLNCLLGFFSLRTSTSAHQTKIVHCRGTEFESLSASVHAFAKGPLVQPPRPSGLPGVRPTESKKVFFN